MSESDYLKAKGWHRSVVMLLQWYKTGETGYFTTEQAIARQKEIDGMKAVSLLAKPRNDV